VEQQCRSCGAPTRAERLTCDYCGVALVDLMTPAEELTALNELVVTAQKLATRTDIVGHNYGIITGSPEEKRTLMLTAFWQSAFMPRSSQALISAFNIALAGIAHSGDRVTLALRSRAFAALSGLRVAAANEPELAGQIAIMSSSLDEAWKRTSPVTLKKLGLGCLALLAIPALLRILLLGGDWLEQGLTSEPPAEVQQLSEQCKGLVDGCDDNCRQGACAALCQHHVGQIRKENQWACTGMD
jgi:hypothetical protein